MTGDAFGATHAGDHAEWSELAVGHALDALEPADEQRILAHLADCARCRELVAETSTTMADLALAVPLEPPPARLREAILAAAENSALPPFEDEPAPASGPTEPVVLPSVRPPRSRRWPVTRLAVAAAVAILAVLGAGVWTLVSGPSRTSVAEQCARVNCPTVVLRAGASSVGQVMVLDGSVYLQPTGMSANDPARNEYVLWRLSGAGTPVAVGGFDVRTSGSQIVRVGVLGVPLRDVATFAVTREPGRTPPSAPSTRPIAAGTVTT